MKRKSKNIVDGRKWAEREAWERRGERAWSVRQAGVSRRDMQS